MRRRRRKRRSSVNKAWRAVSRRLRQVVCACEVCGEKENLVVHHILARRTHPALTLDEKNLIVLCRRCHWKVHRGHEWEFMVWLKKNRPDLYAQAVSLAELSVSAPVSLLKAPGIPVS